MKKTSLIAALSISAALTFATPSFAQDAKVIAKVGEKTITQSDLDQAMKDLAQQFANFPEAQRKARALDSLIDIYVLSQKADAAGMDDEPTMKSRLDLLRARALHNAWFQDKIQNTVSDEALKTRFDAEVKKAPRQQEVSARHILVKTEEEAKAIIAELEAGADFVELAKTKSTGPSGPKGGDLGYFTKGRMVPEFETAAFAIEKGDFTKEPVKTQFGFHIIKVEDKRDTPLPKFEAAKAQIQQIMMAEAYAKAIKAARAETGVEVLDNSLKLPSD